MSSEILALKNSLVEKKKKIAMYTDIRETYYDITRGDYISKIVEDEKLRREQECQKQIKNKRIGVSRNIEISLNFHTVLTP